MKILSIPLIAAISLSAATSAMAWESKDGQHSTSASVNLTTDYVWRGYSQTDEDVAIQGSFDYGHSSGFYAGIWASNVGFAKDSDIEVDIYGGYASEFGESGISYDVGVLRYMYPGTNSKSHNNGSGNLDWNEVYLSLGYSYFTVGVAHSTSFSTYGKTATYYSAGFDYELPAAVNLSAGIGYYDYDKKIYGKDGEGIIDYRIGVSKELVGFGFDLTYTGTNNDGEDVYGEDIAEGRLIFSISKSL